MVILVLFFALVTFGCLFLSGSAFAVRSTGTGAVYLGAGVLALGIIVNIAVSESVRVKELQAADDGILYVTGQSETFAVLKQNVSGQPVRMFKLQELKTEEARQAATATTVTSKKFDAIVGSDISSPIKKVFTGSP